MINRRVDRDDSISMALLMCKHYADIEILSKSTIDKFDEIINENLESINSQITYSRLYYYNEVIYEVKKDEKGNFFYLLDKNIDLDFAFNIYLGCADFDIVAAVSKEKALDVLGLKKDKENKLVKK